MDCMCWALALKLLIKVSAGGAVATFTFVDASYALSALEAR